MQSTILTRAAPLAIAAALAAAGCAAPSSAEAPAAETATSEPETVQVAQLTYSSFADWRADFRRRAGAQGVSGATFDRAFAGVGVNERVLELDGRQPEFTRPIWEYLDSAVSETRIANGREKAAEQATTLAGVESAYGVEKEIVTAIWGLESAYGFNMGSIPVVESLATLAYDGRRRAFAEEQLIEALKIIQAGDVAPGAMIGSWAGAMGHTQFIPTSFQAYAQDFTGDGRRDVWAADPADALASTANYLARFGWTFGQPWGVEARLPDGFDYALADQSIRRPVSFWRNLNVTTIDGLPLPDHGEGAILLPAGAQGPAFVVFGNFRVIKRYNNATSYALAVGHLADRIRGDRAFVAAWPRGDRPLSRTEKREMQALLTRLGFDTKGVDGIIGPNSTNAIRGFQRSRGMIPDGYASARFLEALRSASGG
ncbi:MAG: lytic murein transglycosylase [Pseudomonadota bacterium]